MSRPNVESHYLGAQPRFSETKMELDNRKKAEFEVSGSPSTKIVFKTGMPVKVVTKLTQCSGGKELPEYVYIQRDSGHVRFHVAFPENGWYKFQIFAMGEKEPGESLPNVYNYLIDVQKNTKPVYPYVKAYTKFYTDNCSLKEPKFLSYGSNMDKTKFRMAVPGATKVAAHLGEEWHQFTKHGGDRWEGEVDIRKCKNHDDKLTVLANYEEGGSQYSVLLDYKIQ